MTGIWIYVYLTMFFRAVFFFTILFGVVALIIYLSKFVKQETLKKITTYSLIIGFVGLIISCLLFSLGGQKMMFYGEATKDKGDIKMRMMEKFEKNSLNKADQELTVNEKSE